MIIRNTKGYMLSQLILKGSFDGSVGVNATITVVVAGEGVVGDSSAGGKASLGGSELLGVDGSLGDNVAHLLDGEAWVGREDQGNLTSNSGASHGGSRERGVGSVGGGVGRADSFTGGGDVGLLEGVSGSANTGTAGREGREGIVLISGADSNDNGEVSGGVGSGARRSRVSLGEEGNGTGINPGLNVGKVGGRSAATSPGVGNEVSTLSAVFTCTSLTSGADDPFGGGNQVRGGARRRGATLGGNPLGTGGNTNTGSLRASEGSHGVGSMSVVVVGLTLNVTGVKPVVIVVEGAAIVSAVVVDEGLMGEEDSSVNVGDGDSSSLSNVPGFGGTNDFNVPFGGALVGDFGDFVNHGVNDEGGDLVGFDFDEVGEGLEGFEEIGVHVLDQDGVGDPVGLVLNLELVEDGGDLGLELGIVKSAGLADQVTSLGAVSGLLNGEGLGKVVLGEVEEDVHVLSLFKGRLDISVGEDS